MWLSVAKFWKYKSLDPRKRAKRTHFVMEETSNLTKVLPKNASHMNRLARRSKNNAKWWSEVATNFNRKTFFAKYSQDIFKTRKTQDECKKRFSKQNRNDYQFVELDMLERERSKFFENIIVFYLMRILEKCDKTNKVWPNWLPRRTIRRQRRLYPQESNDLFSWSAWLRWRQQTKHKACLWWRQGS